MKKIFDCKKAFTLPEVLIAIAIIGVVAAMTIPTLNRKIKEREFLTAHKRINSMITGAMAFVENNEGVTSATNAEDFVNNVLSRYLKISKICGYTEHEKCGFDTGENKIKRIDEVKMTLPTTMDDLQTDLSSYGVTLSSVDRRGYSFLSSNGYSMMLFYNPNCKTDSTQDHYVQDRVCVNIVWDMNGLAEPNKAGNDIGFTTVLYPRDLSVVTPMAYESSTTSTFDNTGAKCLSYAGEDYRVPNRDELASLYFNGSLINQTAGVLWSSEAFSEELGWSQGFYGGLRSRGTRSGGYHLRCVRR